MSNKMKIMLAGGGGIGDLIFYLPLAKALKLKYPNCKIDLLIRSNEATSKMLSQITKYTTQTYIDSIYYYNSHELIHNIYLLYRLINTKYTYGILLAYAGQARQIWPYKIFKLIKCKIIGLRENLTKNMNVDFPISLADVYSTEKLECLSNIDAYFSCASYFDIYEKESKNTYFENLFNINAISKDYPLKRFNIKGNYIVLCIGANPVSRKIGSKVISNDIKSWNIGNWIELSNLIIKQGIEVVLLGGRQELTKMEEFKIDLDPRIHNLVGNTDIMESLSIIRKSFFTLGCDTGLMHCASALDVRTMILLGATSEKQAKCYGEKSYSISKHLCCSPCFGTGRDVLCNNKKCMKDISVNEVFLKLCEVIKENKEQI